MQAHVYGSISGLVNRERFMWMAIGVIVMLLAIVSAPAQTLVTSCGQTLSSAGQYLLANNLDCSGTLASGINITSSNVVLHLGGRTLSSTDCDETKGIAGIAVSSVTG